MMLCWFLLDDGRRKWGPLREEALHLTRIRYLGVLPHDMPGTKAARIPVAEECPKRKPLKSTAHTTISEGRQAVAFNTFK
jgi:hypothetical protein